ncbi:MAG TPA: DUF6481 family protein [Caulobacteraceae bacterium]|jgi:predicted house-cleaning NTP pyrophosphatase (Maf/HAM1 superfamily)|nr:DUF6481 family protein [Caulobacteraceae bacterium]
MKDPYNPGHAERQAAASEARKALLAKMKPKPAVAAPDFESRQERRAKELERVREERALSRAADRQNAVDREAAVLEAKRNERRERKALTKVEQKARRDAKYAARKARQR